MWIIPGWAQWIAFVAVLATLLWPQLRDWHRPGTGLRTYLDAIRRSRQPLRPRRRSVAAVATAVALAYAVIVIADSLAHQQNP